jgi:tetratricopeptide (TPR) repeat protein
MPVIRLVRRSVSGAFVVVCLAAVGASAQKPASSGKPAKVLPRPKLPAGADSNDVRDLLVFGNEALNTRPEQARRAFYWASRLDPLAGSPLQAQYDAWLLSDKTQRRAWIRGDRRELDPGLDSLEQLAAMRDPFTVSRQVMALMRLYVADENPLMSSADAEQAADDFYRESRSPVIQAMYAESYRQWPQALDAWSRAAKAAQNPWSIYATRGRIFRSLGQRDSAIASYEAALAKRPEVKKGNKLVVLYQPAAMLHFALAQLHGEVDNLPGMQQHLEKALEEDASFWPAQLRLALIAQQRGDTAAALAGLELAAATSPNEPLVLMELGYIQIARGMVREALATFKKVTELEPYYAQPHLLLGQIYEHAEFTEEAAASYAAHLALLPASAPTRAAVGAKITSLKAAQ